MNNEQEMYPLCKQLGIKPFQASRNCDVPLEYVFVSDLERLLSSAPVVYGNTAKELENKTGCWGDNDETSTHSARILCIEPIVRESEERRLLREFVKALDHTSGGLAPWAPTLDEAKALLAKAEEKAP